LPKLKSLVTAADAVAGVNWNSILGMTAIWEGLDKDVLSHLTGPRKARLPPLIANPCAC
jgi:hypothetical protein